MRRFLGLLAAALAFSLATSAPASADVFTLEGRAKSDAQRGAVVQFDLHIREGRDFVKPFIVRRAKFYCGDSTYRGTRKFRSRIPVNRDGVFSDRVSDGGRYDIKGEINYRRGTARGKFVFRERRGDCIAASRWRARH